MAEHREAVVVGALGVIGRYIVERLLAQANWSVIGLSRRTAAAPLSATATLLSICSTAKTRWRSWPA